jgi:hypothetical protein
MKIQPMKEAYRQLALLEQEHDEYKSKGRIAGADSRFINAVISILRIELSLFSQLRGDAEAIVGRTGYIKNIFLNYGIISPTLGKFESEMNFLYFMQEINKSLTDK